MGWSAVLPFLHARSLALSSRARLLQPFWVAFNAALVIFYGFLHQGGIIASLVYLSVRSPASIVASAASPSTAPQVVPALGLVSAATAARTTLGSPNASAPVVAGTVVYYHTYMPPLFVLHDAPVAAPPPRPQPSPLLLTTGGTAGTVGRPRQLSGNGWRVVDLASGPAASLLNALDVAFASADAATGNTGRSRDALCGCVSTRRTVRVARGGGVEEGWEGRGLLSAVVPLIRVCAHCSADRSALHSSSLPPSPPR